MEKKNILADDKNNKIFLKHEELETKINDFAKIFSLKLKQNLDNFCFVVILKGALQFFCNFYNKLNLDILYVFAKCYSYNGEKQNKEIDINFFFKKEEIKNKTLIFVDDIYDSGKSCKTLAEKIEATFHLNNKKIFLFLFKRKNNIINLKEYGVVHYIQEVNNNYWLNGFGMDTNNKYRYLRDVYFKIKK